MEQDQKTKYMRALANAIALVIGERNDDYNRGGIGLRDYWKVNGIKSPIQMVDMKLKRAFSQIGTWTEDPNGHPIPPSITSVMKLQESMLDLINYAAFVICEAESLAEENLKAGRDMAATESFGPAPLALRQRLEEAVQLWQHDAGKSGK